MSLTEPIRVLIADDHPVVRAGLATMLEIEPEQNISVVGQAKNGREAIELWESLQPDVGLMDLKMPEIDGVAAIAAIYRRHPNARLIVLTTYDGDEDIYRGLRAGARGYLLKDAPREQLLAAIRTVHAGGKFVPSEIAARLAGRAEFEALSARETEILQWMAQGKSNRDIARIAFITEGTVKFHVNRILDKLGANSRSEAVVIAAKRGLVHLG
jgi:two-component system NarL family response regulator